MAITLSTLTQGVYDNSSGNVTSRTTASISPTANRLVLVGVCSYNATASTADVPSSISGAGLNFTLVGSTVDPATQLAVSIWRAMDASPSTGALTINWPSSQYICQWQVVELAGINTGGANGASAVQQYAGNKDVAGTATSLSSTLSAFQDASNLVIAFSTSLVGGGTAATPTEEAGYTRAFWGTINGFFGGAASASFNCEYKASSDTTPSITWGTGGYLLQIAAEINQAGIGGGSSATLSSPTPSGTLGTQTTATIGATTDQTSGTFYAVVDSAANLSGVTATQIKAGQKASGSAALAANSAAVSTTTPSAGVTGLTAGTLYSYAAVQNNSNGDSNVVTGTFTTAAATPTLEQTHYRFRNDDGSETTATWAAAEDTNVTIAALTPKRLRVEIAATNNPASKAYKLQYRKVGDSTWRDIN